MAQIRGKVTDQKSGEPLLRRNVVLMRSGEFAGKADTLAAADFELAGLEPAEQEKWYGAARYPVTIHVEEREQRFVDMRLFEVRAYSVTAQLPAGYESAEVQIWHDMEQSGVPYINKLRTGAFRIEGILPGIHTLLVITGPKSNRAYGSATLSISDHDIDGRKIALRPGIAVTGRIRMGSERIG